MIAHILLAHGSRLKASNDAIFEIHSALMQKVPNLEVAFLELCEPTLEDAITSLHSKGASKIVILPLFIAAGRHIKEDIPRIVKAYENTYNIEIETLSHIGEHSNFLSLIENAFAKTTLSF